MSTFSELTEEDKELILTTIDPKQNELLAQRLGTTRHNLYSWKYLLKDKKNPSKKIGELTEEEKARVVAAEGSELAALAQELGTTTRKLTMYRWSVNSRKNPNSTQVTEKDGLQIRVGNIAVRVVGDTKIKGIKVLEEELVINI